MTKTGRREIATFYRIVTVFLVIVIDYSRANKYAKILYDDILKESGYNKLIRPVQNESEVVIVDIALKISQLIDVDEKNQVMTTNVWVTQKWKDPLLTWDPREYNDVIMLYVPVDSIWHPDLVLYNNADGNYKLIEGTKATVYSDGTVKWQPPATLKSSCDMDVRYFPFDEQTCKMRFGSWTYNIDEVDIRHMQAVEDGTPNASVLDKGTGIDLNGFYRSVEWDVMEALAEKDSFNYAGSEKPFPRWTFSIRLSRRFLFYTINLIIPLVSHAFITVLVFYLPADSGEKIALSINILLSLTVFFLMLAEIIPATSLVVPLLGKYLTFTMFLVVISVIVTCMTYNVHFRSSATHIMPDWIRKIFLYWMPRILMMKRPKVENSQDVLLKNIHLRCCPCFSCGRPSESEVRQGRRTRTQMELMRLSRELDEDTAAVSRSEHSRIVQKAIQGALYIANHLRKEDEFKRTKEDWKYVALVIDRFFLWIYCLVLVAGTTGIICQAPMLYDTRKPLQLFEDDEA